MSPGRFDNQPFFFPLRKNKNKTPSISFSGNPGLISPQYQLSDIWNILPRCLAYASYLLFSGTALEHFPSLLPKVLLFQRKLIDTEYTALTSVWISIVGFLFSLMCTIYHHAVCCDLQTHTQAGLMKTSLFVLKRKEYCNRILPDSETWLVVLRVYSTICFI